MKKSLPSATSTNKSSATLNALSQSLSYLGGSFNLPNDLPKSLSITPAPSHSKTLSAQSIIEKNANRLVAKTKTASSKKSRDQQMHPYNAFVENPTSTSSLLANLKTNPSLSITPEATSSRAYQDFNSHSSSLLAYNSFLDNYIKQTNVMTLSGQSNTGNKAKQAGAGSRGGKNSKNSVPQRQQQQMQASLLLPQAKKQTPIKNVLPSYDLTKNITNYNIMPKASPNLPSPLPSPHSQLSKSPYTNISGRSSSSIASTPTPPLTQSPLNHLASPPKTLQQKLAERKKQNQQQSMSRQKPGDFH